ncbi:hypothetical protein IPJ72_05990 [Candidatus Peregrinibacteria bacterium]|nr:MAG: hypothetical protein IPJ72_05990 [Candidatus Peregrinibacteria bacterium]
MDNTTGAGNYAREVITSDYLNYLIHREQLPLQIAPDVLVHGNANFQAVNARDLGQKWIRENNMQGWIESQLKLRQVSSYNSDNLQSILDSVAIGMVREYRKQYYKIIKT